MPDTVLIVGGGIAGFSAAAGLRKYEHVKDVTIIIIEPKYYLEIFWAAYRSPFDEATAEGSLFSLEKFCAKNDIQHIPSAVTHLTTTQATLENGQVIDFDVAILATGATTQWDGLGRGLTAASKTKQERLEALKREGQRLLHCQTVVVVGGGLIGSEVAGELVVHSRNANKSVRVIVVHSGPHLCHNEMNQKAGKLLQDKLEELGVRVVLNEKLIKNKSGKMTLQGSGEELHADEFLMTVGNEPMNSFVDPSFLNDKGWVEVDDYFQVKGAEGKLFAMGDCCTLLPNSGYQVLQNSSTLGWNVSAVLVAKRKNSEPGRLSRFCHVPEAYIVTTGTEDGVAYTPFCASDWVLPWFKNQTMFLFEPRWKLGLEP